ncbi:unnamed protein product [Linum trigynum]|uniref:Uncharacterized protein n=1 Tax=Linum trigynum TaxID=586398 RepID=A0AAV2E686_9ROSI
MWIVPEVVLANQIVREVGEPRGDILHHKHHHQPLIWKGFADLLHEIVHQMGVQPGKMINNNIFGSLLVPDFNVELLQQQDPSYEPRLGVSLANQVSNGGVIGIDDQAGQNHVREEFVKCEHHR